MSRAQSNSTFCACEKLKKNWREKKLRTTTKHCKRVGETAFLYIQGKMQRTYKRKYGSRNYINYTQEKLEAVIEEAKIIGIKAAHRKYSIPYGTLQSKLKNKH